MPLPYALIVAQPSARAPPLRVPFAAQALLHCMPQPLCPVGPLSVPKHAGTHVHPSHPSHRGCIRFRSGKRLPGFYETMLGCISTCSLRAFQRSHSRVRQPPSGLSGFESGVQNQVRPPVLTPPFTLTAAQPSPPAPPYVCRVQPKHPCIACRTHSAQAARVPRPEHAHTHRPPCRPHAACAYVSGPGWRLPECEKTFFGAISTCASALFQRCHARVRLLPCVVASCCLLWCLALWPVRG